MQRSREDTPTSHSFRARPRPATGAIRMQGSALAPRVVVTQVRVCDARGSGGRRAFVSKGVPVSTSRKTPLRGRRCTTTCKASTASDDTVRSLTALPKQIKKLLGLEPVPTGFPTGPTGDVAVALGSDPLKFIVDCQKQHGDVVGLRLAGELCVLVSSPSVAKDVLIDRADLFIKQGTAFFPNSSLAGNGLLVSDGEVWKRQAIVQYIAIYSTPVLNTEETDTFLWQPQRRLSNPAFRKQAVDTYASSMKKCGNELLTNKWHVRTLRDVYSDFNDLTLTIVADALFGADVTGKSGAKITSAIKNAFEFFGKRSANGFVIPEWVPTPDNVEYNDAVAILDEAVYALIAARRAKKAKTVVHSDDDSRRQSDEPTTNQSEFSPRRARVAWDAAQKDWVDVAYFGSRPESNRGASASQDDDKPTTSSYQPDLLDRLLDAKDTEGDGFGMDDKSLRDELMTLLVAGQETSAILLSWCVSFVAEHPEIGERCRLEADEVFGGIGEEPPSWQLPSSEVSSQIFNLKYCQAVVYETMRLRPPAYMVGRCCASDVTLDGYDLPKGTTVLVAPYLLHTDERNWDDVETFTPERWLRLDPNTNEPLSKTALKGMGPNGAYVPFGAGPRVCIGTGFAMMETTLLLAMICQNVELRVKPEQTPPKPRALITLRPEPFELDVVPRRKK